MSVGAGAKNFPPHAIRMTCDVPGGPIEAPDTGYPIGRPGVVMHFTSMRTNLIRPHRAMTAHQPFAHSHAPDRRRCQHRQLGMGGKGGGSGLGGAKIDTDSVRMTYLRTSNVDLTPRIKPFVQTTGIEIPDVELPAGGEEAMRAEILARCWRPRRALISLNDDAA